MAAAFLDDLRALYAVADGDGGVRLMDRYPWFNLRLLVQFHHADRWWASSDTWRYHELHSLREDSTPFHTVRRSADRPGWILFAESTGGDFLAVDMDPAENGRPGQVIRVGRNYNDGPVYVADSVTTLLRLQLEALEQGDYRSGENDQLWIHWKGPDQGPTRSDVEETRPWGVLMSDTASLDLASLGDTPLEILEAGQKPVDFTPLAGHPTLCERAGRPPSLAAAVLTGDPSPGTLAEWAGRPGDPNGYDFRYYSGELPANP